MRLVRETPVPIVAAVILLAALALHPGPPSDAQDTEALVLEGDLVQGGLVRGRTEPGAEVHLGERKLRVSETGSFVFGFHRDAPATAMLTVILPDGQVTKKPLEVASRTYRIQRIEGLPQSKVTPPPEVLERIQREADLVHRARAIDSARTDYDGGFIWPASGPISGVYGSQRILNGEPRQPHYGVDIAVPEGTPVIAPADGVVVLAEPELYFSGGTLMLDHGHGVMSAFLHLSAIEVPLGKEVRQGEVIAKVGATGRVTGAHLDWRINWFEERIDAALLVPPMPKPEDQAKD